ncbi:MULTISPECIES: SGNH/GDSL hydrolase family protein [unclassified Streptomyces]|uniref:SGNH/GDSL hydrolase family protein n=1 Tax=unclassified Streptomyces TaxID=2593676 RepID=UPI00081B00BC|nr:SGNH/GDSL hydrolase family protein [Streptomyces sp. DvalAA-43]MYQ83017.1 SGNH/GDSL hydrolase family protein [Streptomyces sp. SID4936]SCD57446.1 GDSL-like Lipase/Acylhydrolase family protein [Streptomyces sp. DvalAA-43]
MNLPQHKGFCRSVRTIVGALALTGLAVGTGAVPASAATEDGATSYVALGDSMASGPLIPDITGPVACGRSTHNYAHELASRLGASLRDVTCSGAASKHMTEKQSLSLLDIPMGSAPPQFDALRPDTDLVTLTIGGNDTGLVGIAQKCTTLDPNATPCKEKYNEGGVDQVGQRIAEFAPKLGVVLDSIHQRSPHARVIVTGYGLYIKPGGCWPLQPVLPVDADFLQGSVDRMNTVIAEQSAAHGAEYIDLATPSKGHDSCQAPSDKWVEGYVPTAAAAPLHPNRNGEENYAALIGAHLQGS